VVQYSDGPIITLHGRITAREYVGRLGNQVHPMIQTLYRKNDALFQDDSGPDGTVQSQIHLISHTQPPTRDNIYIYIYNENGIVFIKLTKNQFHKET
jgi:hypothetical protein